MSQNKSSLYDQIAASELPVPVCPDCRSSKKVVRSGFRNNKNGSVQLYLCKPCNKRFTARTILHTSYPAKIILSAITQYNLGHTLAGTAKEIRRRNKINIPISTMNGWINRYSDEFPFIKLRKRFDIDPASIQVSKKLYHQQVYEFQYHTLKLNIAAKRYPGLKDYIYTILAGLDASLFTESIRASTPPDRIKNHLPLPKMRHSTENNATRMTRLPLTLARTNKERHEKVENFLLVNDSATVATEVPVYLTTAELQEMALPDELPLTGHIDILQVRGNRLYIMDYKPGARTENNAYVQLMLYALALNARTGIELKNIVCAYFDNHDYYEFTTEQYL